MAELALEYVVLADIAVALALWFVKFHTDPVSSRLALDFANKLDVALLSFVLPRDQLYAFSNGQLSNLGHCIFLI